MRRTLRIQTNQMSEREKESWFRTLRCLDAEASLALCMSKDVDKLAEGIAHIESPNAPRLISRSIFYRKARFPHAFKGSIDIIDFDRQIRCRRVGTTL